MKFNKINDVYIRMDICGMFLVTVSHEYIDVYTYAFVYKEKIQIGRIYITAL